MKDLVIKNGTIVTPKETLRADILIRGEKIEALLTPGTPVAGAEVFDAEGKTLIPGCVDAHTHMMDPGTTENEEFPLGTKAAAMGGVTTVIDHHRTVPAVYSVGPLREKIEYLNTRACVDFGLKGGISPDNLAELEAMWQAGITGFKTFTCNLHGVKAMNSDVLLSSFEEVKRLGGTVLIHCEDEGILCHYERALKKEGRTDNGSHWIWRNKAAERVATDMVIELAELSGCRVVIAHVSQGSILRKIRAARERGVHIYAESCPHYLYLTYEDLLERGPWVKFTPPMNTQEGRDELRRLFAAGYVTTIGSDHCPYPYEVKKAGEEDIWKAPNGIPGVETSLRVMLNNVNEGCYPLSRVVECMCENPAKIYGLYPRKGHIAPGADADIVVLNMETRETLKNEDVTSKCHWTPYAGKTLQGVAESVFLRGKLIVDHRKYVGSVGDGRFQPRETPMDV